MRRKGIKIVRLTLAHKLTDAEELINKALDDLYNAGIKDLKIVNIFTETIVTSQAYFLYHIVYEYSKE